MSPKLCIVQITKVDLITNEKDGGNLWTVKPRAIEQLEKYLAQLEAEGLAMRSDDQ